ncbi:ejaculatory bulb-specific protein 3-like isoform X2 [Phlebotomus argentipes]|uniref:ejaculatory bulb-specific protein 3-like isoform X2 n=1 Tax=Phlebotomus argentipes TaxID=94469 RepID=UPI0028937FA6|nr:ejaculatory bulb-specific protein 3-like isoform X2 [Phlebotomus argentipes]
MRSLILCCALAVVALAAPQDKYTTKYDNVDIEEILKSDRLFNNYFKCLMDQGRCTPDGSELKRILPEALESNCTKCSEAQRRGSERVLRFVIDNKPEQWKQLQAKYDPKNVYVNRYREQARK